MNDPLNLWETHRDNIIFEKYSQKFYSQIYIPNFLKILTCHFWIILYSPYRTEEAVWWMLQQKKKVLGTKTTTSGERTYTKEKERREGRWRRNKEERVANNRERALPSGAQLIKASTNLVLPRLRRCWPNNASQGWSFKTSIRKKLHLHSNEGYPTDNYVSFVLGFAF